MLARVDCIHDLHTDAVIPASLPLHGSTLDHLQPFAQGHDLRPQQFDLTTQVDVCHVQFVVNGAMELAGWR